MRPQPVPSATRLVGLSASLLLLGCCWIIPHGDFRQLGTVPQFWLGIGIMGLGFILSWRLRSVSGRWFWGVVILTRLLLLPMYPGDDIWRYLWEGYIQTLGYSPYHLAPTAPELIPYRTEWWTLINHPGTSAIYPPITQWGFRLLAAIAPSVLLFKSAFALADLFTCWLLSRRFGYQRTLLYAWNPLVIYSFAGGAHYDSWFILALVAAWLKFEPFEGQRTQAWRDGVLGAAMLGISVAVKWISLPILGFVAWDALRRRCWLHALILVVCGLIPLGISALPYCQDGVCPLIPLGSDFVTQGRSADLIPHIVRSIWPASRSLNWLYAIPVGLTILWLIGRSRSFRSFTEWYFFALMILSPVIHAWYLTWLVPFAVASRNLGTRWASLSIFVYFVLQQRLASGQPWQLTTLERILVWGPFILGWLWSTGVTPTLKQRWSQGIFRETP